MVGAVLQFCLRDDFGGILQSWERPVYRGETAIWAHFLLNKVLIDTQLFGGLLVFAGLILLRFGER